MGKKSKVKVKVKVSPYIPVNNIDYFMPKPTDWLDWMEKYTREAPPNMDYGFMDTQLIFAKHLLKLLEHGLQCQAGFYQVDECLRSR